MNDIMNGDEIARQEAEKAKKKVELSA